MNFYAIYSIMWTGIIFLYSLGWSDYNKPLNINLLIFFVISISIMLIIGGIKNKQKKEIVQVEKLNHDPFYLLVFGFVLDFFYSKDIPLISIILGKTSYMDFTGIPYIHLLLISFGILYSFIYFDLLLKSEKQKKRNYLIKYIILCLMYLLLFSRQVLSVITVGSIILFINSVKKKKIISKKKYLLIIIVFLIFLYLFGILGNLRSGMTWNDCSLIEGIGRFNNKWPVFLPKQYMWAYLYITNPLANLNTIIMSNTILEDSFLLSIMPDVISDRLFSIQLGFWGNTARYGLVDEYLNACTGFVNAAISCGVFGIYIYFIIQIIYCVFFQKILYKTKFVNISSVLFSVIIIFTFFLNTLSYSAISLLPLCLYVITCSEKIKVIT